MAVVVLVAGLGALADAQRGQGSGQGRGGGQGTGQGRGRGQVASPQPVFRAVANYVSLDVVVTDSNDRVVTDLRQDEFRIVEGGRPQVISDFTFVSIPASHRPIDLGAPRSPAADVLGNALSANASRALAIVVDDTILRPDSIVPIKRTLKGLLEGLAPDDQVAFTYVRRSDLGHDFTNDRDRLAEAVNELGNAVGFPAPGRFGIRDMFIVLENVIDTLSAARQSRKAIVLVNIRGCDPSNLTIGPLCRGLIEKSVQNGVPIYGLNPLGLMDAMSSEGAGAYDSEGGRAGLESAITDANNSLKILAENTGGRAFVRSNLQSAVQEVMADNGNFYLMGYYPNPRQTDGKFHDVDVTVTRPGLRVRSRKGYLADGGKVVPTTPGREMTRILGGGLPDPRLPIRAFVAPLAVGQRGTTAVVTVELTYPVPEGGFKGDFQDEWRLGILALDADAKVKASFQRPLTFTGTWLPTARGTFVLNEVIDLPHDTATVRVGVTSRVLDKTGSVHLPMTVPNFAKKELQLSPLVIGVTGDWAGSVDAVIGLDRIRGLVPFQPTPARTFTRADSLRVYSRASWKGDALALTGDVRIVGAASSSSPVNVRIEGRAESGGRRTAVVDQTVSLEGLTPGAYILRVTAHAGEMNPAIREIPFEIR